MRHITKDYVKKTLHDRWWVGLVIANIVLTIVTIITISLSIKPNETQVFMHYSAFGVTGLYKNYWYFLWGYALLGLIILLSHVALSVKLRHLNRRDLALAFLWATLGMTSMLLIFGVAIINIAALG